MRFSHATRRPVVGAFFLVAGVAVSLAGSNEAAQAKDWYKDKNLTFLIGVDVGGEKDVLTRLIARHMAPHVPGRPTAVPQNMPGAGGLRMANYLYNVAPKDGTYVGQIPGTLPLLQATGAPGVQVDTGKFQWIGSSSATIGSIAVWHTSKVKTFDDARKSELTAGSTGRGAMTYILPMLVNEVFGTKFKIVTGYKSGGEVNLAMERGEVESRQNAWSAWKTTRPEWLKEGKIRIIAQAGGKAKDLPGVPSLEELATTVDDRFLVDLINSGYVFGQPLATSPGTPADRVEMLRAAFQATMKDPQFLKEAASVNVDVDPMMGEELESRAAKILATPAHVIARAKKFLGD